MSLADDIAAAHQRLNTAQQEMDADELERLGDTTYSMDDVDLDRLREVVSSEVLKAKLSEIEAERDRLAEELKQHGYYQCVAKIDMDAANQRNASER